MYVNAGLLFSNAVALYKGVSSLNSAHAQARRESLASVIFSAISTEAFVNELSALARGLGERKRRAGLGQRAWSSSGSGGGFPCIDRIQIPPCQAGRNRPSVRQRDSAISRFCVARESSQHCRACEAPRRNSRTSFLWNLSCRGQDNPAIRATRRNQKSESS